jgi:subtilase family serine protease
MWPFLGHLPTAMRRPLTLSLVVSLFVVFTPSLPIVLRAQIGTIGPQITEPVDETRLTVLKGNTHPLARVDSDRGPAPSDLAMDRMLLVLKRSPQQEAALENLLDQQENRSSPNYHRWLTPEAFGEEFGPSEQDIQVVTSWLASHGFQVNRVSKGRTLIEFSGTAGGVGEAFHTAIHKYSVNYPVNGSEYWANASDPEIPSALAPVVAGFSSLNNFPTELTMHIVGFDSRVQSTRGAAIDQPEFTFPTTAACSNGTGTCYGMGPWDFATIYNVLPLWNAGIDGTGETIAVVGTSDINIQDVRDFRALFGLPARDPIIIYNGPDPGITIAESEGVLDVEWSGGVAKGATIDFVVSASTNSTEGFDLSAEFIVDNNLAPILTESYLTCEPFLGTSGNLFEFQLWQEAAAQGITVAIAAGDSGSAGCDNFRLAAPNPALYGLQVNGLASTPYDVALGGTDFNQLGDASLYWNSTNASGTHASAKGYIPEVAWNGTCTNQVFGTNAESDCNNPALASHVWVRGTTGGESSCTASDGQDTSSCTGGYAKPVWQAGPGVPNDGVRDIPDVSLFAAIGFSGSSYIVCEADADPDGSDAPCDLNSPYEHFLGTGGTSAATQAFGGIMALVEQKAGARQGNANPVFYALAAQESAANCNTSDPLSSCVFNDVTQGTNAMPCIPGSPNCVTANPGDEFGVLAGYSASSGYDLTTGLGTINASNLVNANAWAGSSNAPDFTLASANPVVNIPSGATSGNMSLTITSINGFSGTFNLSSAACSALPAGDTCSFSKNSVTINPGNPMATPMLTVTLGTPALTPGRRWKVPRWPEIIGVIALLWAPALLLIRAPRRWRTALALAALALLVVGMGCGGGGGGGGGGTTSNGVVTLQSGATRHSFVFTIDIK